MYTSGMAPSEPELDDAVVELDEMLVRPGTYFNPQTEVVVIVDDSASMDQEIFNMEAYEGADWVRISDEVPSDPDGLDAALESFQTSYHPGVRDRSATTLIEGNDEELEDDEDGPQPGRED
jgi:hypothetical protein